MSSANSAGQGINLNNPIPTTPQPVETPQVVQAPPVQAPQTSSLESTVPVTTSIPTQPEGTGNNKPTKKNRSGTIIIIVLFILTVLSVGGYFLFKFTQEYISRFVGQRNIPEEIVPKYSEELSKKPKTKPLMAPDFLDKRFWEYVRNEEIDTNTAKSILNSEVGEKMGAIQVSNNDALIHKVEYKGIPIMWSDNQPIPEQKIEWLKEAIDLVPETFLTKYPINGIYSATKEEMKIEVPAYSGLYLPGIIGFASGGNIFVTSYFTTGKTTSTMYAPPTKDDTIYLLVHEWTHIAQFYEMVKTFTDEYLSTGVPVGHMTRFIKDYAKTAGWVFDNGEFLDDGSFLLGTLGSDPISQKISTYGKSMYKEDQAEAFALFFTCRGSRISQPRLSWIEEEFNVKYLSICN